MEYAEFLAQKAPAVAASGFDADIQAGTVLFPFQADIVRWALRMGKAAVFTATGSGKTRIQATWADQVAMHTDGDVLIVAPLAVAAQTVAEASRIGIQIRYCRAQADVQPGVTITNYDMLHAFDPSRFVGVVLEESSILKSHDSRTRRIVTEGFAGTPYRLCCTANPAPNDYMELGNHAEFLGVMTQAEMLSMYFVHDGGSTQDWRLKGHAIGDFWRWVASWSVLARTPADLGYSADGYILPPLRTHVVTVDGGDDWARERGYLFAPDALSLNDARSARRESMAGRVQACADLVNGTPGQWLVWCALNAEGDELARRIPGAVQVAGADSREWKEAAAAWFTGDACICNMPEFRAKLTTWQQKDLPDTGKNTTPPTASNASRNPVSTSANMPTTGAHITPPTTLPTENASQSKPKSIESVLGLNGSQPEKQSMPPIRNPSSEKPKSGKKQTLKSGAISTSAGTGLPLTSTIDSSNHRAGGAPYAAVPHVSIPILEAGSSADSTSITATIPGVCAASYAPPATSASASSGMTSPELSAPPCICGHKSGRRILVSKSSIFGFGLNFQGCHQMAFVGVDYSYEGYYQAVRRCWRFGQTQPVDVHLFLSDAERGVLASLNEKAAAAERMADEIVRHVGGTMRHNLGLKAAGGSSGYNPQTPMRLPEWLLEDAS